MSIKSTIQKIFIPKYKQDIKQLGGIVRSPSEEAKRTGGFVSTSDPSVPGAYQGRIDESGKRYAQDAVTVKSGDVSNSTKTSVRGGSGGGSSSSQTGTPIVTGAGVSGSGQEFSGKVEVFSNKGTKEETKYYVKGRETGRIFNDKTGEVRAETKKVSKFTFDEPTSKGVKREVTEFTSQGANISNYEMMIGGGDIRPPTQGELLAGGGGIFLTSSEAKNLGITTSFNEGGIKTGGQRSIEWAESFFNKTPGSTRMTFLGQKDIVGTGFESKTFSEKAFGLTPIKDIGIGASKFIIRTGLVVPDILSLSTQQTFKEGEKPKIFDLPFGKTETRLKERYPEFKSFMDKPTSLIGTATEIGLNVATIGYGGFKSFKNFNILKSEYGTKGAIIESFGFVSPVRIKPGIYTNQITEETPFKFISFNKKTDMFNVRNIVGKGEGFEIYSKQVTKMSNGELSKISTVENVILQEGIKIGGGKVSRGIIYTKSGGFQINPLNEGIISKVRINKGKLGVELGEDFFKEYKGGISNSAIKNEYSMFFENVKGGVEAKGDYFNLNKFKVSRGAGISKNLNEYISEIGFGKRTSVPTQRIEGDVVIREPSGKYRFKPTVQGIEIDLNKYSELQSSSQNKIISFGKGKTPLSDTFKQIQIQKPLDTSFTNQLSSIKNSLTSISKPSISKGSTIIQSSLLVPSSSYYGTGQYERASEGISFGKFSITGKSIQEDIIKNTPIINLGIKTNNIIGVGGSKNLLSQFQIGFLNNKPKQYSFNIESPIEISQQKNIQRLETAQIQKQIQITKQPIYTPSKSFNWGFGDGFGFLPPIIPPLFLPEGKKKMKTFERGFKISPSFGSVLGKGLGIKFETFKFGGTTGILERPFKKGIELPTII